MISRFELKLNSLLAMLRLVGRWMAVGFRALCLFLLVAWTTLAIHYSNLPWPWLRTVLAVVFASYAVWALCINRRRSVIGWFFGTFVGVLGWWCLIPPSHDRPWKPEVAVMPRAVIHGDLVKIKGFRNFIYRSQNDFTVAYEERDFDLSRIVSVDFFASYWMPGPVGHTFVSFNFEDSDPLCISIEVRPEIREGFSSIGSLFKQFELIYVAGDERDIVGVRTNHRHEDVFLYPTRASKESARRLLGIYLARMNQLAEKPEFYHLLSNSCTINMVRYANAAGNRERPFDFRYVLNGLIDQYLYSEGIIDNSLPFADLKKRAKVNSAAQAAGIDPEFSKQIRITTPPESN